MATKFETKFYGCVHLKESYTNERGSYVNSVLGNVEVLNHKDVGIDDVGKGETTWALRVSHPDFPNRATVILGCQIRAVSVLDKRPAAVGPLVETFDRRDA